MTKQRRKKNRVKKSRLHPSVSPSLEKGFDFAEKMRVMGLSDIDFNQTLRDANVCGCAYGYKVVEGVKIPSITLLGENRKALETAFEHFSRWGCEEDGDSVDIQLLLKRDGTYEMWVGPETERSMFRTVPELSQSMMMNVFWVKKFDSTNPMVQELKEYCDSKLISPVAIDAAIIDPKNPDISQIKSIDSLPKIIKFDLKILTEEEHGDDPRFRLRKGNQTAAPNRSKDHLSPEECCESRKKALDVAFPISRERVRRSDLVNQVRILEGFADVTETQVIQAAINLMLSNELVPGDCHYRKITEGILEKIWKHIFSRFDMAGAQFNPADQAPQLVAHQIELDVRFILRRHGALANNWPFVKLQALFRRKGYLDD